MRKNRIFRAFDMAYPRNIEEILARTPCPGSAPTDVSANLEDPMLERLFGGVVITNRTAARLCQAGLLLRTGHAERAHAIAQSIGSPDGAFWHAILHRIDGDHANSGYWYRRPSLHPVFAALLARAKEIAGDASAFAPLVKASSWDPERFVEVLRHDTSGIGERIAQAEWELLFDHCYRKAVEE
jgi:hypothetical protein